MQAHRTAQETSLVFLIVITILLPACIVPATAQSATGTTVLYFTTYDPFNLTNADEFGNIPLSLEKPIKTNDSEWPPSLFVKNKLIPEVNSEEWLAWFEMWVTFKFFYKMPEFEEFADMPELQGFIDMYNPFKVREAYTYTGTEIEEINGPVTFDLFISSTSKILHQDIVKVSVSKSNLLFVQEIKNTTTSIKPTILPGRIKPYSLVIDFTGDHVQIEPGDILVFSVEIIPSERAIGKVLTKLSERGFEEKAKNAIGKISDFLSKRRIEKLKTFGETLKEFLNMSEMFSEEGINITLADFADLANGIRASSFIFASSNHLSKVTLPLSVPQEARENEVIYYLHKEKKMDTTTPTGDKAESVKVSDTPLVWESPTLENTLGRSKILIGAEATIYLDARNLLNIRKITLSAELFDAQNNEKISSSLVQLDRTKILDILKRKDALITFPFENTTYELAYNHGIRLEISLINGSKLGLRKLSALYDSSNSSSSLNVLLKETDNIKVSYTIEPTNGKIIPGGSVIYTLNITSKYADDVTINIIQGKKIGSWEKTISTPLVSIPANGYRLVNVYITSTDTTRNGYNDSLDFTITATGKTGMASTSGSALVSTDAIKYDVKVRAEYLTLDVKRGENGTFEFYVKNNNTGAVDDYDNYQIVVTSENGWDLEYLSSITNLRVGREKKLDVVIVVPRDTSLSSDTIMFKATSNGKTTVFATLNVTLQVKSDSILEILYNFFKSAADQLGLTDIFGSYAPIALAALLLLIFFFIIIVIALLVTRKTVMVQCQQMIQEIDPEDKARFEINILNPSRKKTRTYDVSFTSQPLSSHWNIALDASQCVVEPRQMKTIMLTVQPTDHVQSGDWIEVVVGVGIAGRKKRKELHTMILIKSGKPELRITNVFHWPQTFSEGEKVTTSFKVENTGKGTARNVTVTLYINGREKNKVQELNIPADGFAEITIPWIAEKGKNDVHITLNK